MNKKSKKSLVFLGGLGLLSTLPLSLVSCGSSLNDKNTVSELSKKNFLYNEKTFTTISELEDSVFSEIEDFNISDLESAVKNKTYILNNRTFTNKNDLLDYVDNKLSIVSSSYYLKSLVSKMYMTINDGFDSEDVSLYSSQNIVNIYKTANGKYTTDKEFAIRSFYTVHEQFFTKNYSSTTQNHIFSSKEDALNWLQSSLIDADENVKEVRVYDPSGTGQKLTYGELFSTAQNYINRYVKVGNQYYDVNDLRNHMDDVRGSISDVVEKYGLENKKHPGIWNIGLSTGEAGDFIGPRYYSGMTAPTSILDSSNWVVDSTVSSGYMGELIGGGHGGSMTDVQRRGANSKLALAVSINEWRDPDDNELLNWRTFFSRMLYALSLDYGETFVNNFRYLAMKEDIFSIGAVAWNDALKLKGQGLIHSFANSMIAIFNKIEISAKSSLLVYYMNKFFGEGLDYFNTVLQAVGFRAVFRPVSDVYNDFYKRYVSDSYNSGGDSNAAINLVDNLLEGDLTHGFSITDDSEIEHASNLFHALTGSFMLANMARVRMMQTVKVIRTAAKRKFLSPMPGGGFDAHMEHEIEKINSEHPDRLEELNTHSELNSNIWLPGRGHAFSDTDNVLVHELWGQPTSITLKSPPSMDGSSNQDHIIVGQATTVVHNANYDHVDVEWLCFVDRESSTTHIFQVETGQVREFKLTDTSIPRELEFAKDGQVRLVTDRDLWDKIVSHDWSIHTFNNFHEIGSPMVFGRDSLGVLNYNATTLISGNALPNMPANANYDHVNIDALYTFSPTRGYKVYDLKSGKIITSTSYSKLPVWFKRLPIGKVREVDGIEMLQIQNGKIVDDNIWNFHQLGKPSSINDFGNTQMTRVYDLTDSTPRKIDDHTRFYVHIADDSKVLVFDRRSRIITTYDNPQSVPVTVFAKPRRYMSRSEVEILQNGRIEINFDTFGTYSDVAVAHIENKAHELHWTQEEIAQIRHPYYLSKQIISTSDGHPRRVIYHVVDSSNMRVYEFSSLASMPKPFLSSIDGDIMEIPFKDMRPVLKRPVEIDDFRRWNFIGEEFSIEKQVGVLIDRDDFLSSYPEGNVDTISQNLSSHRDYGGPKFLVYRDVSGNGDGGTWVYNRQDSTWTEYAKMSKLPAEVLKASDTRAIDNSEYLKIFKLESENKNKELLAYLATVGSPISELAITPESHSYRWIIARSDSRTDPKVFVFDTLSAENDIENPLTTYENMAEVPLLITDSPFGSICEVSMKGMNTITSIYENHKLIGLTGDTAFNNHEYIDVVSSGHVVDLGKSQNIDARYGYYFDFENDSVWVMDLKTGTTHHFDSVIEVPVYIRNQKHLIRIYSSHSWESFVKEFHNTDTFDLSTYKMESSNTFADFTNEEIWNMPSKDAMYKKYICLDSLQISTVELEINSMGEPKVTIHTYENNNLPDWVINPMHGTVLKINRYELSDIEKYVQENENNRILELLHKKSLEAIRLNNNDLIFTGKEYNELNPDHQWTPPTSTQRSTRFFIDISGDIKNKKIFVWEFDGNNSSPIDFSFENIHSIPKWITESPETRWITNYKQHVEFVSKVKSLIEDNTNLQDLDNLGTPLGKMGLSPHSSNSIFGHSYLEEPVIPQIYIAYNSATGLYSAYRPGMGDIVISGHLNDIFVGKQLFGTVIEIDIPKFDKLSRWIENKINIDFSYLNEGSQYVDITNGLLQDADETYILGSSEDGNTFGNAYREKIGMKNNLGLTTTHDLPPSMFSYSPDAIKSTDLNFKFYLTLDGGPETIEDLSQLQTLDHYFSDTKTHKIGVFDSETGIASYYTLKNLPLKLFHELKNGGKNINWITTETWGELSRRNGKYLLDINNDLGNNDKLTYSFHKKVHDTLNLLKNSGKLWLNTKWTVYYSDDNKEYFIFDAISKKTYIFSNWYSIPTKIRLSTSIGVYSNDGQAGLTIDKFSSLMNTWATTDHRPAEMESDNIFRPTEFFVPGTMSQDLFNYFFISKKPIPISLSPTIPSPIIPGEPTSKPIPGFKPDSFHPAGHVEPKPAEISTNPDTSENQIPELVASTSNHLSGSPSTHSGDSSSSSSDSDFEIALPKVTDSNSQQPSGSENPGTSRDNLQTPSSSDADSHLSSDSEDNSEKIRMREVLAGYAITNGFTKHAQQSEEDYIQNKSEWLVTINHSPKLKLQNIITNVVTYITVDQFINNWFSRNPTFSGALSQLNSKPAVAFSINEEHRMILDYKKNGYWKFPHDEITLHEFIEDSFYEEAKNKNIAFNSGDMNSGVYNSDKVFESYDDTTLGFLKFIQSLRMKKGDSLEPDPNIWDAQNPLSSKVAFVGVVGSKQNPILIIAEAPGYPSTDNIYGAYDFYLNDTSRLNDALNDLANRDPKNLVFVRDFDLLSKLWKANTYGGNNIEEYKKYMNDLIYAKGGNFISPSADSIHVSHNMEDLLKKKLLSLQRSTRSLSKRSITPSANIKDVTAKMEKIKKMSKVIKGIGAALNMIDFVGLFLQMLDGITSTQRVIYRTTLPNGEIVRWNGAINRKYLFSLIQGEKITMNNVHFRVKSLVSPLNKSSFIFDGEEYSSKDEAIQFLTNNFVANPLKFIFRYSDLWSMYYKTKTGTTYHKSWRNAQYELINTYKTKYTNGYAIYDTYDEAKTDLSNKAILSNSELLKRVLLIFDPADKSKILFSQIIPTLTSGILLTSKINELKDKANRYIEDKILQTKKVLWADVNENKNAYYDSMWDTEKNRFALYEANIGGIIKYFKSVDDAIMNYLSFAQSTGNFKIQLPNSLNFSFKFHNQTFTSIDDFRSYLIKNYKIS